MWCESDLLLLETWKDSTLEPICSEIFLVIPWIGFDRSLCMISHAHSLCQRGTLEWSEVWWELLKFSVVTPARNSILCRRVMALKLQQSKKGQCFRMDWEMGLLGRDSVIPPAEENEQGVNAFVELSD